MSEFVKWSDTKSKIREIDPEWDSPERVAAREASREQLRAELRGTQLAEMRKRLGISQKLLAERMGVSQARVSQIEHGQIGGLDALRSYVVALGGDAGRGGRLRRPHREGRLSQSGTHGHLVKGPMFARWLLACRAFNP
ncbi:helix-turn-helix domain-containing protein [Planomonospora venezuelensis]|uniref:helix-turn-helix domain-containing protein n=1 Tax=Planomonospora venezuelensis TaxID=1999 RepID=UPI0031EFB3B6